MLHTKKRIPALYNHTSGMIVKIEKPKELWILKKYFLQITGMSAQRFTKNKYEWRDVKGKWDCKTDAEGIKINVNSIPTREDYIKLSDQQLLDAVANLKAAEQLEKTATQQENNYQYEVYGKMYAAFHDYHTYYNHINDQYTLTVENCKVSAQKWAVWQWILDNYNRFPNSLVIFHAAYTKIFPAHLKPKISFSNFYRDCRKFGIEKKVIDLRTQKKEKKRNISSDQYVFLQKQYIQPQKTSAKEAYRKLKNYCKEIGKKSVSERTVSDCFKEDFYNNIELAKIRYGAAYAQKMMPYASLEKAAHRNTQWQQDGWIMPFWGADFQRYTLYLIWDNHSRKILSGKVGLKEDTTLVLKTFEDAVRTTGVLPGEAVTDKHSWTKGMEGSRILLGAEKRGTRVTVTINAQRNQVAERHNRYLDALCEDYEGYLGKNITAKSKDGRPAPEAMEQYRKAGKFKTDSEVAAIAQSIIIKYNHAPLDILDGLSPNEAYDQSESLKAFKLSETEILDLFKPMQQYKVHRGQINIMVGKKKHEFQLSSKLINNYNNREVNVIYEDLTQGIYITDIRTGEELGSIEPKRKIAGAIPDQTPEDIKMLNQQTGRSNGVTIKARKAATRKIESLAGLHKNPEALEIMDKHTLPKDLHQEIAQSAELRRAMADNGIDKDLIPIRTPKNATLTPLVEKTTASPFSKNTAAPKWVSPDEMNEDFFASI